MLLSLSPCSSVAGQLVENSDQFDSEIAQLPAAGILHLILCLLSTSCLPPCSASCSEVAVPSCIVSRQFKSSHKLEILCYCCRCCYWLYYCCGWYWYRYQCAALKQCANKPARQAGTETEDLFRNDSFTAKNTTTDDNYWCLDYVTLELKSVCVLKNISAWLFVRKGKATTATPSNERQLWRIGNTFVCFRSEQLIRIIVKPNKLSSLNQPSLSLSWTLLILLSAPTLSQASFPMCGRRDLS